MAGSRLTRWLRWLVLVLLMACGGGRAEFSGRLEFRQFESTAISGNLLSISTRRPYAAYLPPQYETNVAPMPVLYVLHSFGGNHTSLINNVCETYDSLLAAGEIGPVILIFPNLSTPLGGSFGYRSPANGDHEASFVGELVPDVDATYRTLAGPEGRGLIGYSHGGTAAMHLGLLHPDIFGAVAAHAALYDSIDAYSLQAARTVAEAAPKDLRSFLALPLVPEVIQAFYVAAIGSADLPWPYAKNVWAMQDGTWQLQTNVVRELARRDVRHGDLETYLSQRRRLRGISIVHGLIDGILPVSQARGMSAGLWHGGVPHHYLEHPRGHLLLPDQALLFMAAALPAVAGQTPRCAQAIRLDCPPEIEIDLDEFCHGIVPPLTNVVRVASCWGLDSIVQTPPAGTTLGVGGHSIRLAVSDVLGNTNACSVTLRVRDAAVPAIIACPPPGKIVADAACRALVPDLMPGLVVRDCSRRVLVDQTPPPGSVVGLGIFEVSFVVRDPSGRTNFCVTRMEVVDALPPVFAACPRFVVAPVDEAGFAQVPDLTGRMGAADCGGSVRYVQSPAPNTFVPAGHHPLVMLAMDPAGNTSTCESVLVARDDLPTEIVSCGASYDFEAGPDCRLALPDLRPPTASSEDGTGFTAIQSPAPGTLLGLGIHSVKIVTADPAAGTNACLAMVRVRDTTPPTVIECPADLVVTADDSGQAPVPDMAALTLAVDCAGGVRVFQKPPAGTLVGAGVTNVIVSFEDDGGNVSRCGVKLVVRSPGSPGLVGCPGLRVLEAQSDCRASLPDLTAGIRVEGADGEVALGQSPAAGSVLSPGVHQVVVSAVDAAGRSNACLVEVRILDLAPPRFSKVPAPFLLEAEAGLFARMPDVRDQVGTEDCSPVARVEQTPVPGALVGLGLQPLSFVVVDSAGNSNRHAGMFYVRASSNPVQLGCVTNRVVGTDVGCAGFIPDLTDMFTSPAQGVLLGQLPAAGSTVAEGNHLVQAMLRNEAGTVEVCLVEVDVIDALAPVVTSCPAELRIQSGAGCDTTVPDFSGQVRFEECHGPVVISQEPVPGSHVAPGTRTVTWTLRDLAGNMATCSARLVVVDSTPPMFTECPGTLELAAGTDCQAVLPDLGLQARTRDCAGPVSVVQDPPPGALLGLGQRQVLLAARDPEGNVATCTVQVRVVGRAPPRWVRRPEVVELEPGADCLAGLPDFREQVEVEDCVGTVALVQRPGPGTALGLGAHEVTLLARDPSGNMAETVVLVMVPDRVAPSILGFPAEVVIKADSLCGASVPDLQGRILAADCDSGLSVTQAPAADSRVAVGLQPVVLVVRDRAGNTNSCTVILNVRDMSPPVMDECPPRILYADEHGLAMVPDWTTLATVRDCSEIVTLVQDPPPGSVVGPGVRPLVTLVADRFGNTNRCEATVTVRFPDGFVVREPVLRVSAVESRIRLSFETQAGVEYRIEDSDVVERTGGSWNLVRNLEGTGSSYEWDVAADAGWRYFRVVAVRMVSTP